MPAIEMVALRDVPELLGGAARVTVAEPSPEDALETTIQAGKPETAQKQEEPAAWMLTVKKPPEAGASSEVDPTEYIQEACVKTRTRLFT
jgi:hypothetical protein